MQKMYFTGERMKTAYYRAGVDHDKKLLLIHGNVSSSEFYLPLFEKLSERFDTAAPDLRCFGDSDALPVDATRGYRDFTEDIHEFAKGLGWDKYYLLGWSLGGCIAMQYCIDYADELSGLILLNSGSPFGFGGTKGEEGTMLEPAGLASGGGCANAQLIKCLGTGETELLYTTLHNVYFKPPFTMDDETEKMFVSCMLKTKTGEGMYPGDMKPAAVWPFVASGDTGICNTMSPVYGNVSGIADIPEKPPVLWIRGDSDIMVSDTSLCDFGFLGMLGSIPGWPGDKVCPPQPMVSQIRFVLNRYRENGGSYTEKVIPGGHACQLESPQEFIEALDEFMK